MFKLVIQDDEGKTTIVPLIRDEITIGRKEGNTIRLTERNVSRRHARIVRAGGSVAIEDLGSYNGVRVNGTRIAQRTSLSVSDRVQIGDYLIELKSEATEGAGTHDDNTKPISRPEGIAADAAPPGLLPLAPDPASAPAAAVAVPPAGAVPATGQRARLVVLSSNFAGKEFELTQGQMLIGRTDDNDVVINHRSISRNHAKVVREAQHPDRFTISDLQSSNGVRVNGEDYGKVELRRGDTIDLGHVRLRFVEAGEDFLFGRDAQVSDVPATSGRGRFVGIFAILAVLALGGAAAAVMFGGNKTDEETNGLAVTPIARDDAATTPPPRPPADATTVIATPIAPDAASAGGAATEFAAKLGECRAARDQKNWKLLKACAAELEKLSPGHPDASSMADLAKSEAGAEALLAEFTAKAKADQFRDAFGAYARIPQDSSVFSKAEAGYESLKDRYIAKMKRSVAAAAKNRRCGEHKQLIDDARLLSEAYAAVKGSNCVPIVAVEKPDPGTEDPPSQCSAADAIDRGRAAFDRQDFRGAVLDFERANRCQPTVETKMLLVMSACRTKDPSVAKKYWDRFPGLQGSSNLIQACLGLVE